MVVSLGHQINHMSTVSIQVRFHLAQGKNYMKWQVKYPDRKPEYYDPKEVQLVLGGCVLKNNKKTAQKIFEGAHKTVCAKVLCSTITVYKARTIQTADLPQIKYNPRVRPNWMWGEEVMDGCSLHTMVSDASRLHYHERWGMKGYRLQKSDEWVWEKAVIRRYISSDCCSVDF